MKADARCCLITNIRNTRTVQCVVLTDRDRLMGKKVEVSAFKVCAGKSIVELIEDELDALIVTLMEDDLAADEKKDVAAECRGLAMAVAIIRNPYEPDVNLIREQAMNRYSDREMD